METIKYNEILEYLTSSKIRELSGLKNAYLLLKLKNVTFIAIIAIYKILKFKLVE